VGSRNPGDMLEFLEEGSEVQRLVGFTKKFSLSLLL